MNIEKFDKTWDFWKEENAFGLASSVPESAKKVQLPHDAMMEEKVDRDSRSGVNTGYFDGAVYIYSTKYYAPIEDAGRCTSFLFDGVYMNAFVYINGAFAGKQHYGYSEFEVRAEKLLRYGQENEIRVVVRNGACPNSRWYCGGGIYRDVYLMKGDLLHIPHGGVRVSTEAIYQEYAVIVLECDITNRSDTLQQVKLSATFFGPNGEVAAECACPYTSFGAGTETIWQRIVIKNAQLWSAENPALYTCSVQIDRKGTQVDCVTERFGIRLLALDACGGLRVNGNGVKLRGACVHHDNGLLGAVSTYEIEKRRVCALKKAGFNAILMAHNPSSAAFLKACDEVGVYVVEELFDMWTNFKTNYDYSMYFWEHWESDCDAMIRRARNHPSVLIYAVGNEIPECGSPIGAHVSRKIAEHIHKKDPTRYTVNAINGVFGVGEHLNTILADVVASGRGDELVEDGNIKGTINDFMSLVDSQWDCIVQHPLVGSCTEESFSTVDIAGYQYMTARYEQDAFADRVILGTEAYPPRASENWRLINKLPHVIGDFTWAAWDYIGESGLGVPGYDGNGGFNKPFPCYLAGTGDFDITGVRRPSSYYREIVFGFRKDPYLCVQDPAWFGHKVEKTPWTLTDGISCWNWPGAEGKDIQVTCFFRGERLELYQNGVLVGTADGKKDELCNIAELAVKYYPGELQVVSYENEQKCGEYVLRSAEKDTVICLYPEKRTISADENDYLFIDVRVEDQFGIIDASVCESYSIEVSGAVQLAAVGNANVLCESEYINKNPRLYQGRAQIILRSIRKAGPIQVQVHSEKYGTAELVLNSVLKTGGESIWQEN